MNVNIKRYVKERDEMLKKCSVEELTKFMEKHKHLYAEGFYEDFVKASYFVKEATLYKMIVNVPKLPKALRAKSYMWLCSHGMSAEL